MKQKLIRCSCCRKEITEKEAAVRGERFKDVPVENRRYAKCSDCDYRDYSNTYGGM